MEYSEQQLAVFSAQKNNILPVTSTCNLHCVFCSHQGNPPEVQTFSSGHRSLEEIKNLISFLQSGKKIVIGESVTKICEGEPLTHPQIEDILTELRANYPATLIKLTTNGALLTEAKLDLLAEVGPLELNVSVNSITDKGRSVLMNDSQGQQLREKIKQLAATGITYHGSIVAMPHIIGWIDLEETIAYLDRWGAETIRVFLPGYTQFSPEKIKFDLSLREKLADFIANLQTKYKTPLTLEPAIIEDLTPEVAGVLTNSPAEQAGLQAGDEIISIAQKPVYSRVDAFQRLLAKGTVQIKVRRKESCFKTKVVKSAGAKSGLVMGYDLAPRFLDQLENKVTSVQAEKILLLSSQLAYKRLKSAIKTLNKEQTFRIKPVANHFFGGSIMSAGLLVVADFRRQLEKIPNLANYDLILLPQAAFDFAGYDLVGEHFKQLENEFPISVNLA